MVKSMRWSSELSWVDGCVDRWKMCGWMEDVWWVMDGWICADTEGASTLTSVSRYRSVRADSDSLIVFVIVHGSEEVFRNLSGGWGNKLLNYGSVVYSISLGNV